MCFALANGAILVEPHLLELAGWADVQFHGIIHHRSITKSDFIYRSSCFCAWWCVPLAGCVQLRSEQSTSVTDDENTWHIALVNLIAIRHSLLVLYEFPVNCGVSPTSNGRNRTELEGIFNYFSTFCLPVISSRNWWSVLVKFTGRQIVWLRRTFLTCNRDITIWLRVFCHAPSVTLLNASSTWTWLKGFMTFETILLHYLCISEPTKTISLPVK